MIVLNEITKAYKVKNHWNVVLDDVSVSFPTNVSVGILGLNGSGKSTLLRIIGGTEPPDRGAVKRHVRVSWPIAFGGGFHPLLTGRENARFIARIYGESSKEIEEFAYEFSELGEYFDMAYNTYSSGMRARLAFAVSMACDFDCYLVDEVTAVGDKRFSRRYREAFAERLKNASVVMVSHNTQTIRQFCTVCYILNGGKIEVYESVEKALGAYNQLAN